MEQHESGENTRKDFVALLVKLKDDEKRNEHGPSKYMIFLLTINLFQNKRLQNLRHY